MTPVRRPRTCANCGRPVPRTANFGYNKYCGSACRRRALSFSGIRNCPVEGCQGELRRSSLAVCNSCWHGIPEPLRATLSASWHEHRAAGVSNLDEAREALTEAKQEVIQAATEARLVNAGFTNQDYYRKQAGRLRTRRRLGMAA